MTEALDAMLGALVITCLFAAIHFAMFWRQTRDRFFAWFTAAMILLAINWVGVLYVDATSEARNAIYVVRLLAFVLIIVAIVDKNRRSRS